MLVYLPRIQKIEESDLLLDHAAISTFGDRLEGAVRADSLTWLAARTVGPDERKGRSKEIQAFPTPISALSAANLDGRIGQSCITSSVTLIC